MIRTDGNPTIANSHGLKIRSSNVGEIHRLQADVGSLQAQLELASDDRDGWKASYSSLLKSWSDDQDTIKRLSDSLDADRSAYMHVLQRLHEIEAGLLP